MTDATMHHISDQDLIRMQGLRIREHVLRAGAPSVRARHDARRTVLEREVVKHPDGVADPVALVIGDRAHIDMQRLPRVGTGFG